MVRAIISDGECTSFNFGIYLHQAFAQPCGTSCGHTENRDRFFSQHRLCIIKLMTHNFTFARLSRDTNTLSPKLKPSQSQSLS